MKKILIIEDNKDVRENMGDMLELANYEVATAENGKKGIEKVSQFHPDIIVCDIMMPQLDGYGVLEALGKNKATAGIPFVFLTAKSEKGDMRKGMNLGADDYLTKPFEEYELLDAVACRLRKNEFLRKDFSKDIEGINKFFTDAFDYLNLETISKDYRPKAYNKKDFIFMEGDAAYTLYFVERGTIKTYKSTDAGKEFVTGIHKAGDFMGQLSLLSNSETYLESATAMESAVVYSIPKTDFTHLMYGNREVSNKFMNLISNNLKEIQEQLVDMAYASVRQRVAKVILNFHSKRIIKDTLNEGIDIAREDFAGLIGTATETAIRTLSDFKKEGLITLGNRRSIIIVDKIGLQNVANFK
ncbi:response regulator [Maribacter sp. ACAM166]|uniref:response regulator n=1 Tax=Maribacter sp. ACAM166 TaxID=2508996 RepID=UPI0010FDB949|nr:response regulator [Maribacter sp. ACAM166]TLP74269.1 response regulator [Maribacter sp. ACAM166]